MPVDFVAVQRRLALVIVEHEVFDADHVTGDGRFAVDRQHRPLGRQNRIGKVFGWAASTGLIVALNTRPVRSRNPRRKAGGNRTWRRTDTGVAWAITFLQDHPTGLGPPVDEQLALFDDTEVS